MAFLLFNLGEFDFEERKNVQSFITELYNNFTEVLEETFAEKKSEIVRGLVSKYAQSGMSTIVGNILRLFTKTSVSLTYHIIWNRD